MMWGNSRLYWFIAGSKLTHFGHRILAAARCCNLWWFYSWLQIFWNRHFKCISIQDTNEKCDIWLETQVLMLSSTLRPQVLLIFTMFHHFFTIFLHPFHTHPGCFLVPMLRPWGNRQTDIRSGRAEAETEARWNCGGPSAEERHLEHWRLLVVLFSSWWYPMVPQ